MKNNKNTIYEFFSLLAKDGVININKNYIPSHHFLIITPFMQDPVNNSLSFVNKK